MKYQPAAILLATAAASSLMMESDGLDTSTFESNHRRRQLMPMYGYCIGCVALVTTTTHNIDNTELKASEVTPSVSSSTVENGALSRYSGGSALDHGATTSSSCSETRLFLPTTPKKNTPSEHFVQPSSSTANNLLQLNLILLSRSIHNNNRGFGGEQQPFLSDICALSLFLMAVAIGIAWGGSSGSTNDKKKKKKKDERDDNEHEFDLISRRLVYDEFFDISLVPTIDDDDDEEEDIEEDAQEQHQQQQEKVEKEATNDISVLSPLVGDITKPQRTLTHHEQQEWKKPPLLFPPTDDEDETSTITSTQEEAIIAGYRKYLPKPPGIRKSKAKEIVKKSILTIRSPSTTECMSATTPKVTTKKRVSFHKDVRVKVIAPDYDEASISSSSSSTTSKKRRGLFKLHKLSLGNLCEVKSREYVPLRE